MNILVENKSQKHFKKNGYWIFRNVLITFNSSTKVVSKINGTEKLLFSLHFSISHLELNLENALTLRIVC